MTIKRDEFVDFLEDYLLEEEAQELEIMITGDEEEDAPAINSLQKANYFLKLVKNIDEDVQMIETLCAEEVKKVTERINNYKMAQIEPLLRDRDYFVRLLKNFTENQLADGKKKSIKLPNGTLAMTKQQPIWEYEDDAIISFLMANNGNDFVHTKIEEKIDKVALKKAVKIENNVAKFNGVEIPGLTVTEREDKFTVR